MRPYRPTAGSAPSRLDASPRSHCSWSSTNISQLHLPGPRNGHVGHRSWSSTNISQLHLHKVPERYRVGCASTNIAQPCVLHTFPPSPKKATRLQCLPTCQALGKTYSYPGLVPHTCVAHVSQQHSQFNAGQPTTTESPLRTWMALHSGTGTQGKGTTRLDSSPEGEADNEQRSLVRTHRTDTNS